MKRISLKLQLFLFLLLFSVFLSLGEAGLSFFIKSIIAVIAAAVTEALYCFVKARKLEISESALISGIIIGFILSSSAGWWVFALSGLFAVISKHLIRFKGKHIFNPAAIGIFLAAALLNQPTRWQGAYHWYLIIPFGLYAAWRIKKLTIISAYFFVYLFLGGIQAYYSGASFIDKVVYANYFFIFVMLIEPKTSPYHFREKIAFGSIVSLAAFLLYSSGFPYDADIPALLIGNLLFRLYNQKEEGSHG